MNFIIIVSIFCYCFSSLLVIPAVSTSSVEEVLPIKDEDTEKWFKAITDNEIGVIKKLIKKKVKINTQDDKKNTALLYAIKQDNFELVKLLLENGANPNLVSPSPVLYEAFKRKNTKIITILLKYGAGTYYRLKMDYPLFGINKSILLINDGSQCSVSELLFNHRAFFDKEIVVDESYVVSLIKSQEVVEQYENKIFDAYEKNLIKEFNFYINEMLKLIQSRKYLDQIFLILKDQNGNTLLHRAVMRNDYELIKYILSFNPKTISDLLNLPNKHNMTPIDLSVNKENLLSFFMEIAYQKDEEQDSCVIL